MRIILNSHEKRKTHMKRTLVIFIFIITSFTILHAENIIFGAHAGLNIASARLTPGGSSDPQSGYCLGVFSDFYLHRNSSVVLGVNYTQKGSVVKKRYRHNRKNTYHMFSLPVQYRISRSVSNDYRLFIGGGLCGSLIMSGRYVDKSNNDEKGDITDVSVFEMSSILSVGAYIKNKYKFEIMYDIGLTDVNDSDEENPVEIKTRTIMITLGVVIDS